MSLFKILAIVVCILIVVLVTASFSRYSLTAVTATNPGGQPIVYKLDGLTGKVTMIENSVERDIQISK